MITRAHLKSWLPSFQPHDAAGDGPVRSAARLRFRGAHAVSAVDDRRARIDHTAPMATSRISDHGATRRTRTGRGLRAGIAAAWGVLVAYALAAAWLGTGSDGSPVREWLLLAVGLFGVAVLVLLDDRHIALTASLAVGCLLGLAGGVYGATALAPLDVPDGDPR